MEETNVSVGAILVELGRVSFNWELLEFAEGGLWSISFNGRSFRGTWIGGCFAGGPEVYEGKSL